MKVFAVLTAWALWVLPLLSLAEGVRYRGIFVNDEDWGLRPWAVRHFGAEEQIGTNAYAEIFALMKASGLNLIWPAMHEGGYEFSARPENLELARHWGITVGTSHCEPMLRNNCYLAKADKKKWSWMSNRDFLIDYWREGVRRGMECLGRVEHADRVGDVLWTIGMRGIHDGRMPDGKTTEEKIKILEEVFAAQCAMLPEESAWDAAAEYEVPFRAGDTMLEIAYDGDMARLYADGRFVQDDFWKGLLIRYALRRLPNGTKRLVLKVLPRGAGWEDKVYVDIIPSLLPNSAVVSSEGLANQDPYLFDREGRRILGGRYYDAFKSL